METREVKHYDPPLVAVAAMGARYLGAAVLKQDNIKDRGLLKILHLKKIRLDNYISSITEFFQVKY